MIKLELPDYVKIILDKLNEKAESYIVGGSVRDLLLNKEPKDYDICTKLTTDEIIDVLKDYKVIDNNSIKYGTVPIKISNRIIEVTTFRKESIYSDHRRPDSIEFSTSLKEDLSRRDFTINALAYNDKVGLVDYFNGLKDLNNGIIRTVGNPSIRFNEDYLRILRALKFSSRYNFLISKDTKEAILELGHEIAKLSKERITAELKEILIYDLNDLLIEYKIIFETIFNNLTLKYLNIIDLVEKDFLLRLCLITDNKNIDDTLIRLPNTEFNIYKYYKKFYKNRLADKKDYINIILYNKFKDNIYIFNILKTISLIYNYNYDDILIKYNDINEKLKVRSFKDLAINHIDLINEGIVNNSIKNDNLLYTSDALSLIFDKVVYEDFPNDYNIIIKYLKELTSKN